MISFRFFLDMRRLQKGQEKKSLLLSLGFLVVFLDLPRQPYMVDSLFNSVMFTPTS